MHPKMRPSSPQDFARRRRVQSPRQRENACVIGSIKMDAKGANVNSNMALAGTIILAMIASASLNHNPD